MFNKFSISQPRECLFKIYVFSKLTICFRGGHCDYLLWAPEKKLATMLNMPSLAATNS